MKRTVIVSLMALLSAAGCNGSDDGGAKRELVNASARVTKLSGITHYEILSYAPEAVKLRGLDKDGATVANLLATATEAGARVLIDNKDGQVSERVNHITPTMTAEYAWEYQTVLNGLDIEAREHSDRKGKIETIIQSTRGKWQGNWLKLADGLTQVAPELDAKMVGKQFSILNSLATAVYAEPVLACTLHGECTAAFSDPPVPTPAGVGKAVVKKTVGKVLGQLAAKYGKKVALGLIATTIAGTTVTCRYCEGMRNCCYAASMIDDAEQRKAARLKCALDHGSGNGHDNACPEDRNTLVELNTWCAANCVIADVLPGAVDAINDGIGTIRGQKVKDKTLPSFKKKDAPPQPAPAPPGGAPKPQSVATDEAVVDGVAGEQCVQEDVNVRDLEPCEFQIDIYTGDVVGGDASCVVPGEGTDYLDYDIWEYEDGCGG